MKSFFGHWPLLALLALTSNEALALGLGEIRTSSRIGERLYAEIDLSIQADERFDAGCVRLVKARNDENIPAVQQGAISLRNGLLPVLMVRSTAFMQEPVVRLGLYVGCGYEIQRDYTLLLSPPAEIEQPQRITTTVVKTPPRETIVQRRSQMRALPRNQATDEIPALAVPRQRESKPPKERRPLPVIRDRLLLKAPGEVGEPSLRLSSELFSWRSEDAGIETQRELLRLEFRMLQALHEQALAQLEASEKLRQMEGTLGELQQRTGEFNRRLEQKTEVAAVSPTATAEAAPAVKKSVKPLVVSSTASSWWSGWMFYTALLVALALLGAWLFGRLRRRQQYGYKNLTQYPEPYMDPRRDSEIEDFDHLDYPGSSNVGKKIEASMDVPVLNQLASAPGTPASPPVPFLASMAAATLDEHFEVNPVMELADIMLSFGRVKGAAQALQEFIDHNPEEALQPWIRLMDVYRMAGMRNEFERVAAELNQHFNVEIQRWESSASAEQALTGASIVPIEPDEPLPIEWQTTAREIRGIEDLEHIADLVVSRWPGPECLAYLNQLLRDNRGGQRSGFSLPVVEEMLFLVELLETLTKLEEEGGIKK